MCGCSVARASRQRSLAQPIADAVDSFDRVEASVSELLPQASHVTVYCAFCHVVIVTVSLTDQVRALEYAARRSQQHAQQLELCHCRNELAIADVAAMLDQVEAQASAFDSIFASQQAVKTDKPGKPHSDFSDSAFFGTLGAIFRPRLLTVFDALKIQ